MVITIERRKRIKQDGDPEWEDDTDLTITIVSGTEEQWAGRQRAHERAQTGSVGGGGGN